MDEARRIFVDAHACAQQRRVIGARKAVYDFFVRHARRDDAHVHAPLCRRAQRRLHHVVDDKVGRKNIHIVPGLRQNINVNARAHGLAVQRRIAERLHPSLARKRRGMVSMGAERVQRLVHGFRAVGVPELQEHGCKIPRGFARHTHARILPMAVQLHGVDVFIRKVNASREHRVPVHVHDLAVVAVVHRQRKHRYKGVEHQRLDAAALHFAGKALGQQEQAAHIVAYEAHVHALGRLALEDLRNAVPHFAGLYDKVFQKNEMLGAFQRPQHVGVHLLAQRIIFHVRIHTDRISARSGNVPAARRRTGVVPAQRPEHRLVLPQRGRRFRVLRGQPAPHPVRGQLAAEQQVQQAAHHGQLQDQDDPADLEARNVVVVQDMQHDQQAQERKRGVQPHRIGRELPEKHAQPYRLQQKQQTRDKNTPAQKFQQLFHSVLPPPAHPAHI